jgi:hypothetical protein
MARGDQQRVQERPGAHTYRRGYWYLAGDETMLVIAGGTINANQFRLYPFRIRSLVQIVNLGTRITFGAAGLMQLAIYPASKRTLQPEGLPVAATGDIDITTAQNVFGAVIGGSAILPRGVYWGASLTNIAGVIAQTGGATCSHAGALVGASTQDILTNTATSATPIRFNGSVPYGTWPDCTKVALSDIANGAYALLQFQVAP